jgi:uncharacterized protein YktB (UPF0637 family)
MLKSIKLEIALMLFGNNTIRNMMSSANNKDSSTISNGNKDKRTNWSNKDNIKKEKNYMKKEISKDKLKNLLSRLKDMVNKSTIVLFLLITVED